MDSAYDHIQEELLPDEPSKSEQKSSQSTSLNNEIQDAYKAISSSPWAARLGGILGSVKKQGEHYYEEARQEYNQASEQAAKGFTSIVNRTRALSLNQSEPGKSAPTSSSPTASEAQPSTESTNTNTNTTNENVESPERPESLPADIVREAEHMLSRFKTEATRRLKDIEKAEDAADEALLKFGTNVRNFLRDAVKVVPPTSSTSDSDNEFGGGGRGGTGSKSTVIFESKDADGKRVLHTTRFDAQLHVIHTKADSFLKDPDSAEYAAWAGQFDVERQTEAIAADLAQYEELKRAMEKLVPEKVEYVPFWTRYYFLRHVVEEDERRRKELLKAGATNADEEVSWDNDSSSEDGDGVGAGTETPNQTSTAQQKPTNTSTSTIIENPAPTSSSSSNDAAGDASQEIKSELLRPDQKQNTPNDQHSQADSDASYDLVSGATSRTQGSPREEKRKASSGGTGTASGSKVGAGGGGGAGVAEDSDEDWE